MDNATTLTDSAEFRLRQDIVSGVLAPMSRLRVDELKTRYATGGSPLREALSRLVGDGLVNLSANRGFRVRAMSPEDLADIAWMRGTIEMRAVEAAIANGDAAWEAQIIAALHRLTRATETTATDPASLDRWNAEHDAFHRSLIAACGSPRALDQQRRLSEQHRRYRVALMGMNIPRGLIVSEHRAMADAVLARDTAAAMALMEAHARVTSGFYAQQLRNRQN